MRAPESSSEGLGGIWPEAKICRPGEPGDRLQRLAERGLPEQDRGEPDLVGHVEELVQPRTAQVAADHHDPLSGLRDGDGHVGQGGRLALGRTGAGELDRLDGAVQAEELDGRAQAPVGLGRDGVRGGPADQVLRMRVAPVDDLGDQAEDRVGGRPPARGPPWCGSRRRRTRAWRRHPTPRARPRKPARMAYSAVLGLTGLVGTVAVLTTWPAAGALVGRSLVVGDLDSAGSPLSSWSPWSWVSETGARRRRGVAPSGPAAARWRR